MSAKISVIIPVYNAEKYLSDTLDSVLNQSFTNFEVIVVNDGSTDSSMGILKEYEAKDQRIHVYDNNNFGVSATRNMGIEHVAGEYICFVDSDDLLHRDYMKFLYLAAIEDEADVVICDYAPFYEVPIMQKMHKSNSQILNDSETDTVFMQSMNMGLGSAIWNRIVKTEVIKSNNICFDAALSFGEDMFFNWKCLSVSNKVSLIKEKLYFYRQSENSAILKYHPDLFQNYKKGFCDIIKFLEEHNVNDELVKKEVYICFTKRLASFLRMIIRDKCSIGNKQNQIKEILSDDMFMKALREYKDDVYRNEPGHAVKMYDAACEGRIMGLMISGMKYEYRLQWGRKIKNLLRKLKK